MSLNQFEFLLPGDILLDIFLLLPFESIVACKRVSKQWMNIINDPNFCKKYHPKGSMIVTLGENNLYCVLMRHSKEIVQYPSCTVHRLPMSLNRVNSYLDHELLLGWSNGIICVKSCNSYFHLYNLFTGALDIVKDVPLRLHSEFWIYYGFGYDPYDDDYKIMVVWDYRAFKAGKGFDIDKVQNKDNSLFWVYSTRNSSWKSCDGFPYIAYAWHCFSRAGSYSFNGVLHYAVVERGALGNGKRVIVTYDLHTCKFGEIFVPDDKFYSMAKVTELDGRLCYTHRMNDECVVEMYSEGGCWTKWVSIGLSVTRDLYSFYGLEHTGLYELTDGRKVALFVCHNTLLWYDFSKKEIKEVNVTETWLKKQRAQMRKRRRRQF